MAEPIEMPFGLRTRGRVGPGNRVRWGPEVLRDVTITTILALCMGAHRRHLANTTEPSVCGGDAALCQITLTTCCLSSLHACFSNSQHVEMSHVMECQSPNLPDSKSHVLIELIIG